MKWSFNSFVLASRVTRFILGPWRFSPSKPRLTALTAGIQTCLTLQSTRRSSGTTSKANYWHLDRLADQRPKEVKDVGVGLEKQAGSSKETGQEGRKPWYIWHIYDRPRENQVTRAGFTPGSHLPTEFCGSPGVVTTYGKWSKGRADETR